MQQYEPKQYGPVQSVILIVGIGLAIGGALALGLRFPWLHTGIGLVCMVFDVLITAAFLVGVLMTAWRRLTPRGFVTAVLGTIMGFGALIAGLLYLFRA